MITDKFIETSVSLDKILDFSFISLKFHLPEKAGFVRQPHFPLTVLPSCKASWAVTARHSAAAGLLLCSLPTDRVNCAAGPWLAQFAPAVRQLGWAGPGPLPDILMLRIFQSCKFGSHGHVQDSDVRIQTTLLESKSTFCNI